MAERIVVANPFANQISTVGPTARPVDIYKKAQVKTGGFESLSKALDVFNQKALPALGRIEERSAEKEFAQGQELFNKTRTSMGEAVKAGLVEEGASPYLRKGYRVARLNTLGARYADELATALTAQKLYKNGSPEAIEKFTTEFYEEFQEENEFGGFIDTEIAQYFSGTAAKANETFRASWLEKHTAWQKAENYRMMVDEVSTMTSTTFTDSDTPEERVQKTASLVEWLNQKVKDAKIDGMDNAKVNEAIVDSLVLSAYENNDASILDVMNEVITGTGPLGYTKEARTAVIDASEKIATIQERAAKREQAETKRVNKEKMDAAVTQGFAAAAFAFEGNQVVPDNPDTPENEQMLVDDLLESSLSQLYSIGTTESIAQAKALQTFYYAQQKAGREDRNIPDENYGEYLVDILTMPNLVSATNFINRGLQDGEIDGPQATQLLSFYGRNQTKSGKPRKATYDDSTYGVGKIMKSFQAIIIGNEYDAKPESRLRSFQFGQRFREMYIVNENEFRRQSGTDRYPTPREAQSIATQIIESLSSTYVSAETVENAADADQESVESFNPKPTVTVKPKKPESNKGVLDGIVNWWNQEDGSDIPDFK